MVYLYPQRVGRMASIIKGGLGVDAPNPIILEQSKMMRFNINEKEQKCQNVK